MCFLPLVIDVFFEIMYFFFKPLVCINRKNQGGRHDPSDNARGDCSIDVKKIE